MRVVIAALALVLFACSSDPASVNVGTSCVTNHDCGASGSCIGSPGICSQACSAASPCPTAASVCTALPTTLGSNLCLPSCLTNAGCKTGYTCCESLGNVCAPAANCQGSVTGISVACNSPAVTTGGVAGPPTQPSSCQKPVISPSFPSAQVQALGPHAVGETLSFTVAPGTGTISILQQVIGASAPDTFFNQGKTQGNGAVPFRVIAPDGGVFYDDDNQSQDLSNLEIFMGDPEAATSMMTFPNTTQGLTHRDAGYPDGTWQLIVNDYAYECATNDHTVAGCDGGVAGQQYDSTVVTKPIAPETGSIDVALYLVTNHWTAAQALVSSQTTGGDWNRFQTTLQSIYATAGICISSFTFYDVPAWAKTAYAGGVNADTTGPCDELDQMFTLSRPGNALPFFFVDDIQQGAGGSNGGTIVGIDGAIPGPSGVGGSVHSGAVVNVHDLTASGCTSTINYRTCGSDEVAYITAHEGGHYMGLFHVSESGGDTFDPLSDTPQCATTCDGNKDGFLAGTECTNDSSTSGASCGGGDYMMFWLLDAASKGKISVQQAHVMLANPVVH
jgi:hypothetical protein